MLLEKNELYAFGEFRLDLVEKVLRRGESEIIALTPKVFETLRVLVTNAGRLLEKDELMRLIWRDRFVEEGNLAFNIRMLRQALGDDAQQPRFIQTVPRRGYRFIAPVERISQTGEIKVAEHAASLPVVAKRTARIRTPIFLVSAFALLVLASAVGFGSWRGKKGGFAAEATVLFAPFASEKLSTNGKVYFAVISPDGKTVLYRFENGGKQSLWLRQLANGSNTEIIPPSDEVFFGLKFAPTGDAIYFVRGTPTGSETAPSLYRVSIHGGAPTKLVSNVQGWFSVSPDNSKISFVRCPYREEENCSLCMAEALDGSNERKLAARPGPWRISVNEIAPDGKTVAFAVGQSENQSNEFVLREINSETLAEREITPERFFDIKSLAWLPNQDDLLMVASRNPQHRSFRIWRVSHENGEAAPLTKDADDYSTVSLDAAARQIVAVRFKSEFKLFVQKTDSPLDARVIADATVARFTPNGKIAFSSLMSGNEEIWICDADGANLRQLTNNEADDSAPLMTADGKTIFFSSNRGGTVQAWRMNADGSGQTPVTNGPNGGFPLALSADERWLYFHHGLRRTLWRIALDGTGAAEPALDKPSAHFAFSPDRTHVAFSETEGDTQRVVVLALSDRRVVKIIAPPIDKARFGRIEWLPDGSSLAYLLNEQNSTKTLWTQSVDANAPPRQIAELGDEAVTSLSFASDSQHFAAVQGGWKHDAVLLKGLK